MLWQLFEADAFKQNNPDLFRIYFSKAVQQVHQEAGRYRSLTDMNKEIIRRISGFTQSLTAKDTTPPKSKPPEPSKLEMFEAQLKKKEEAFTTAMNPESPPEIDFLDKSPPPQRHVENTLQQRQAQLKTIMGRYNTEGAKDWISGDSSAHKIKIHDKPSNLHADEPSKNHKKVRFTVRTGETEIELASLLEKILENQTKIMALISETQ